MLAPQLDDVDMSDESNPVEKLKPVIPVSEASSDICTEKVGAYADGRVSEEEVSAATAAFIRR